MYGDLDVVAIAEAAAQKTATADRMRFAPFYAAAEELSRERGMVLGGPAATLVTLGEPLGLGDYAFTYYSRDPRADARALADCLYGADRDGLGRYVYMRAAVPNKDYTVTVDERPLFRVVAYVTDHRRVRNIKIASVSRPALFAPGRLACAGVDLQLIRVYAALTDPARAGEWPRLLVRECALRKLFLREPAVGGGARRGAPRKKKPLPSAARRLAAALAKDFAPHESHARLDTIGRRARLVTAADFGAERTAIAAAAARAGVSVQTAVNNPHLPEAGRLRYLTVYAAPPGGPRVAVLDVFNTAQYELVPAVDGRGSPFVRLRFILVELWILRLLHHAGALDADGLRRAAKTALAAYRAAAADLAAAMDAGEFDRVFPSTFVGTYEDPVVQFKRAHFGGPKRRFVPPYYPARRKNGAKAPA